MRNFPLVFLLSAALAGCALPRGAPLQSEVLAERDAEQPSFAVVEVSRANLDRVADWPATGWNGNYLWLQNGGGAASPVIRPGDRVDLVIWDSQENSLLTAPASKSTQMNGLAVSSSGTLFVPYVGEVVINGLTPDAARREIQKELERISPSMQVQLSFKPGLANTADLVRGVARPGPVELPSRDYTILSLIAQGGGIAPNLRNPLVRLIRAGKTYEIRADDLFSDPRRNIVIRGGDKVIVDEDKRFFIAMGATGNEKLVYFDRDKITALEALTMAGGLQDARADLKGILILRDYPESAVRADGVAGPEQPQVVFTLDLTSADGLFAARNFRVNPGDLVMATESPMVGVTSILGIAAQALLVRNRL